MDQPDEVHEVDEVLVTWIEYLYDAHDFVFRNSDVFVHQVGKGDRINDAQAFFVVLSEDFDEIDVLLEDFLPYINQYLLYLRPQPTNLKNQTLFIRVILFLEKYSL